MGEWYETIVIIFPYQPKLPLSFYYRSLIVTILLLFILHFVSAGILNENIGRTLWYTV